MPEKTSIIHLFVPGRLCLFGEHSDWAGMYRTINAELAEGRAIVSGIEQGIWATAEKAEKFIVSTAPELAVHEYWECDMDSAKLIETAHKGGYFSYVAGVASYINDNYAVGGVRITITRRDLPMKSGLSSSAAICVLVARAFNQLYHLHMNSVGEMQAAFRGEQRTPSRCGRLDQACAFGVKPVLMNFDGVEVDARPLRVGTTFHWVVANLMASKDTIRILSDLNKAFPFADNEREALVQEALGRDNQALVARAAALLEQGDAEGLGRLMAEAQENFDRKVAPLCEELKAPVLHRVLKDENIRPWIWGAKGVGSQGDGTVQFLARGPKEAAALREYLESELGMLSFTLTLHPGQAVKKAVIPLAGFGTRVFPASKCVKKCFMPLRDSDGLLKPALLLMLSQLLEAGIEEICLVIGEEDQPDFDRFFAPLPEEYRAGLAEDKLAQEALIQELRRHVTFIYQKERLGFGHAVWLTAPFADGDPVLLLLGDFVYRSRSDVNCCRQVIEAYKEYGRALVSVTPIPLDRVSHYGVVRGTWNNAEENVMTVEAMVEKPTDDYAREYLGTPGAKGQKQYFATFGQYVLTRDVYEELDNRIRKEHKPSEGSEFGLTAALDAVREKSGLMAFVPDGECFDIGLPDAYRNTMLSF